VSSTPIWATDRLVPASTPSHYDTLGVSPRATEVEIRQAYRALARRHHPDARGGVPSPEMAAINAAWHVLSDAKRRAAYDASRRPRPAGGGGWAETVATSVPTAPTRALLDPPRFPWRAVAIMALVGSVGVVVLSWFGQPSSPPPIDNLLNPGSCIVVEPGEVAREVPCEGDHDAVVRLLVPFDARCPSDTSSLRDRQGMGWACVDRVEGA
jgi:hypothetical protein